MWRISTKNINSIAVGARQSFLNFPDKMPGFSKTVGRALAKCLYGILYYLISITK